MIRTEGNRQGFMGWHQAQRKPVIVDWSMDKWRDEYRSAGSGLAFARAPTLVEQRG